MKTKAELYEEGCNRMIDFYHVNPVLSDMGLGREDYGRTPHVSLYTPTESASIGVCGYYRPDSGIHISLEKCSYPAPVDRCRNWNWPGSTVDREPFGVICHEVGHDADFKMSKIGGLPLCRYYGGYSTCIRSESGELPLTGYCDGDHEWFAEMFRLFVGNHTLLKLLRPKTWAILQEVFTPVSHDDWMVELNRMEPVPQRIVDVIHKKAKVGL